MEMLTVYTADELVTEWQEKAGRLRSYPHGTAGGEANAYDACAAQLQALLDVARKEQDS
jgi:hypothetical protein